MDEKESFDEQHDRLLAMSDEELGNAWDLSPKDRAAISAALNYIQKLRLDLITSFGETQSALEKLAAMRQEYEEVCRAHVMQTEEWRIAIAEEHDEAREEIARLRRERADLEALAMGRIDGCAGGG